ncbi:MAG TPA: hypothetical protein ACFYD6_15060 [Candidatus Brocadiia bacterium]|nr:hypothetical protein [Candidatus Brocadiales bacterium]
MSIPSEQSSKELTPQETAETLRRILDVVEKDRRKRWIEITCAAVLALATTFSAWCVYQSTLWSGAQTFRLTAAGRMGREAAEASVSALQARSFDALMLIDYIEAKYQGDEGVEKFLFDRFRPEMKKAVDAWLKTDPLNNPTAPPSPFHMAEYVQKELAEAKRQDELAGQQLIAAQEANETSDTYVLLTVLFASVMFFSGICGTFQSRWLRLIVLSIALALLMFTMIALGTMPICRE